MLPRIIFGLMFIGTALAGISAAYETRIAVTLMCGAAAAAALGFTLQPNALFSHLNHSLTDIAEATLGQRRTAAQWCFRMSKILAIATILAFVISAIYR